MKLLGHPLHLMLIHFPSALFPMALVCSIIHYYTNNPSFMEAGYYAMVGGVLLGWFSIIMGTFDLIGVYEKRPEAMKSALIHGGINTIVVVVFTLLAFLQYKQYPLLLPDSLSILVVKALTIGFMIVGNYIGGNLILKHKVAVEHD